MPALEGHAAARRRLASLEPGRAALLTGPPGIGKHLLATAAAAHHSSQVDVLDLRPVTMDGTRQLALWLTTAGMAGPKTAVLDLDGSAPGCITALLRPLEQPPASARLLVIHSARPPATLTSRCEVIRCTPLTPAETTRVLDAQGYGADVALLATMVHGRPGDAPALLEVLNARPKVLQLIAALAKRDWVLTARILRSKWTPAEARAFRLWCLEALEGTTVAYGPGDRHGVPNATPRAQMENAAAVLATNIPPSTAVRLATKRLLG